MGDLGYASFSKILLALLDFTQEDPTGRAGSDRDSTHSADADYVELLPRLFELQVENFYIGLAGKGITRAC